MPLITVLRVTAYTAVLIRNFNRNTILLFRSILFPLMGTSSIEQVFFAILVNQLTIGRLLIYIQLV